MKRSLMVFFLLLALLSGCVNVSSSEPLQPEPSGLATSATEARTEPSEESDNPPSESDPPSAPSAEELPGPNPTVEKYFDYFESHSYVGMIEEDEDPSISDVEMAGYIICALIAEGSPEEYEQMVGFPKEEFDAATMKYFGKTLTDYETRLSTVLPDTGNITSTGWGGTAQDLVLKELSQDANGVFTAVFYTIALGMDEVALNTRDELIRGDIDAASQPYLMTLTFEEKTDENGAMYILYHAAEGSGEAAPPYEVYQG